MTKEQSFELKFTPGLPLDKSPYPGLDERTYTLPKGTVVKEGAMPLAADVVIDQDTPVQLRDGAVIRADIYRPNDDDPHPTIMWYAPYGKRGSLLNMDAFEHPTRMDVPRSWEDGLNSFEAPNPSYWVSHGYVVVSPDPRGIGMSEGNAYAWGSGQTKDEYDLIEWIAEQPWSNGKIGLTGTSYLAMSQYAVAGANPPHLAAIAPWEGALSPYKDTILRGGIPDVGFSQSLSGGIYSNTLVEDVPAMASEHPFYDAYWADKDPDVAAASAPAYVVASWTNAVHSQGGIQAFQELGSKDKWLRISNTHEWTDYYNPEHVEDLRKFFDHYLRGRDNGWENTAPVRMSVLDPLNGDIVDRPESSFPEAEEHDLYLVRDNNALALSAAPQATEDSASYDADDGDGIRFTYTFEEDVEWIGYASLRLWFEIEEGHDADVYAYVRKLDATGSAIECKVVTGRTYPGPNGQVRASLREIDEEASTPLSPKLKLEGPASVEPRTPIALEIPFWPFGMRWNAGESLELQICPSSKIVRPEFPKMPPSPPIGVGKQTIRFGGAYDSVLRIPVARSSSR